MDGCGHCGFEGTLEVKGEQVKAYSRSDYAEGWGEFEIETYWTLFRCPNCGEPTLGRYIWAEPFTDPEDVDIRRLYPGSPDLVQLPESVRNAFDLALRGRAVDPAFYAVGVRRTLEAICDHEDIDGTNLHRRLESLAASGRLPRDLAALTISLKEIGNLGAHHGRVDITAADVPAVAALLEALLEYLYRAPARLAAVKESFAARGVQI